MKAIIGVESAYKEALHSAYGVNMTISALLVRQMVERLSELETAVIDMEAGLRTCNNASAGVLDSYNNL
jgi:hypothetical protein